MVFMKFVQSPFPRLYFSCKLQEKMTKIYTVDVLGECPRYKAIVGKISKTLLT